MVKISLKPSITGKKRISDVDGLPNFPSSYRTLKYAKFEKKR